MDKKQENGLEERITIIIGISMYRGYCEIYIFFFWNSGWKNTTFDLIIVMPGTDNSDTFDIARSIKQEYTDIPLVVLTPFSLGIRARMEHEDLSIFEYVFVGWAGIGSF